jgi:hypothetical protein
MKTTISMQRAGEPACATATRLHPGVASWALIVFGVGVGSATAYLLSGAGYLKTLSKVLHLSALLLVLQERSAWGVELCVSS